MQQKNYIRLSCVPLIKLKEKSNLFHVINKNKVKVDIGKLGILIHLNLNQYEEKH